MGGCYLEMLSVDLFTAQYTFVFFSSDHLMDKCVFELISRNAVFIFGPAITGCPNKGYVCLVRKSAAKLSHFFLGHLVKPKR